MGFSTMLEILQQKNKGKIVFIKLGAFYIATGRNAQSKFRFAKTMLHCKRKCKYFFRYMDDSI